MVHLGERQICPLNLKALKYAVVQNSCLMTLNDVFCLHEVRLLEFKMKDTAPKSSGIIAVAALFSIVSMGVSYVVFDFPFGQSLIVGAAVATLVGVVLSLGWREPQAGPGENDRG